MRRLIVCGIVAAVLPAGAALAASPVEAAIDQALACRDLADDDARLKCLDGAAAALGAARGRMARDGAAEAAVKEKKKFADFGLSQTQAAERDQSETTSGGLAATEEGFGGETVPEIRRSLEVERLKEVTATATSIKVNSLKQATLYLDNGQVWRQLESDSENISRVKKGTAYKVTIERGLMGNYRATLEEMGRTIRVTRIK